MRIAFSLLDRQPHGKDRILSRDAANIDPPTVLADDSLADVDA